MMLTINISAQDDGQADNNRFDANFDISQKTFGSKSKLKHSEVRYQRFNTYKQAQQYASQIEAAMKRENSAGAADNGPGSEELIKRLALNLRASRSNGTFTARVEEGMGVLIVGEEGAAAIEIKKGQKQYSITLQGVAAIEIDEVIKTEKRKPPIVKRVPSTDTGWEVSFNINAHFEPGWVNKSSRVIIQPVVIDCMTEDTVSYLAPLVYEGEDYHPLQDKRMGFNYMKYDPVAKGFNPGHVLRENEPFDLDTNVVYRKEEKDRTYKGAYFLVLEDYTHKMFDNGCEGTGSCLSFKPFKFLNFNVAAAELPLTTEYYDMAESRVRDVPRDLQLRFIVGKDELTNDSSNNRILNDLTHEMRAYGDRLTQIRIEGAASPEGSLKLNQELAKKRALKAQTMIRGRLGRKADYVRLPAPTVVVHTWEDVAKKLEDNDEEDRAKEIRNIIAAEGEANCYGRIKSLAYYDSTIVPILESQRVMKCSYQYEVDHVMDADEVVTEFRTYKADYVSGKKDLSDGDYYNLFASIKDSAELDILTDIAYRHIVRQPAYEMLKLAPYVANKMAIKNIRKGIYDEKVLSPFIDFYIRQVNAVNHQTGIKVNRREMLINQAVNMFQNNKVDTAQYYLDMLKTAGSDEKTHKLQMFITFVRDFFKDRSLMSSDEIAAFNDAYEFVLNSSPDNRAVLYSELHNQMGKTRQEAEVWVNKMKDDNPKKWYLMGLLWSEESNKDGATGVPYYMALFQHSFDLEPKYKRLYFNEGNVSDDIRKQYPYRRKDINKYRSAFPRVIEAIKVLQESYLQKLSK